MARLSRLSAIFILLMGAGSALNAQEPLRFAFKMGGGPVDGSVRKLFGDAGFTFGADFEAVQSLGSGAGLVYGLGYRALPGDNRLLSFIPTSVPATGVNPTVYETRNRLTEGESWGVYMLYRRDLWTEGFYLQGGLKAARTKVSDTDTGTAMVTNGAAITNTNAASVNILAIRAISSKTDVNSTSVGLTLGAGYRLLDRYALELNLTQLSAESPLTSAKSGYSAEIAFSIRF